MCVTRDLKCCTTRLGDGCRGLQVENTRGRAVTQQNGVGIHESHIQGIEGEGASKIGPRVVECDVSGGSDIDVGGSGHSNRGTNDLIHTDRIDNQITTNGGVIEVQGILGPKFGIGTRGDSDRPCEGVGYVTEHRVGGGGQVCRANHSQYGRLGQGNRVQGESSCGRTANTKAVAVAEADIRTGETYSADKIVSGVREVDHGAIECG